jgi:hypothetical protein
VAVGRLNVYSGEFGAEWLSPHDVFEDQDPRIWDIMGGGCECECARGGGKVEGTQRLRAMEPSDRLGLEVDGVFLTFAFRLYYVVRVVL